MFDHVGWGELAVLFVVGMFVFGPERLPKAAADLGRMLRQLREMATALRAQVESELGPEFGDLDLASLRPRHFVQKHLFDDVPASGPPPAMRAPTLAAASETAMVPRQSAPLLVPGERPPYDPDAT